MLLSIYFYPCQIVTAKLFCRYFRVRPDITKKDDCCCDEPRFDKIFVIPFKVYCHCNKAQKDKDRIDDKQRHSNSHERN